MAMVNNLPRHKCSVCGKVKYEKYMARTKRHTRYQHDMWVCKTSGKYWEADCLKKIDIVRPY